MTLVIFSNLIHSSCQDDVATKIFADVVCLLLYRSKVATPPDYRREAMRDAAKMNLQGEKVTLSLSM